MLINKYKTKFFTCYLHKQISNTTSKNKSATEPITIPPIKVGTFFNISSLISIFLYVIIFSLNTQLFLHENFEGTYQPVEHF